MEHRDNENTDDLEFYWMNRVQYNHCNFQADKPDLISVTENSETQDTSGIATEPTITPERKILDKTDDDDDE